jgi:iron complex transport system ATP-binding protein
VSERPKISVNGLDFSYDRSAPILHNLSLEIPGATVTAVLGPNGSGKTTLLSVLVGMLIPQKGTVSIEGKCGKDYSRHARSRLIGLVPQEEYFPFGLTVLDYVLLGRAPYLGFFERPEESDRQVARDALEKTGLAALGDRLVPSLSSGERQLAMVARALAQKPQILLMDEPTSHLDLRNQLGVVRVIRALAAEGVTVVITTHDPNTAAAVASYVVLLRQGQVLAAGPAQTVITSETLSLTYDLPVEVVHLRGRPVIRTL